MAKFSYGWLCHFFDTFQVPISVFLLVMNFGTWWMKNSWFWIVFGHFFKNKIKLAYLGSSFVAICSRVLKTILPCHIICRHLLLDPFGHPRHWAYFKNLKKKKTELPMGHQFGYKQKFLKNKMRLFIHGFALDMAITWLSHQLRVHPKPRSLSLSRSPIFTSSCEREKLGPP